MLGHICIFCIKLICIYCVSWKDGQTKKTQNIQTNKHKKTHHSKAVKIIVATMVVTYQSCSCPYTRRHKKASEYESRNEPTVGCLRGMTEQQHELPDWTALRLRPPIKKQRSKCPWITFLHLHCHALSSTDLHLCTDTPTQPIKANQKSSKRHQTAATLRYLKQILACYCYCMQATPSSQSKALKASFFFILPQYF